jgi:hypothetical protein
MPHVDESVLQSYPVGAILLNRRVRTDMKLISLAMRIRWLRYGTSTAFALPVLVPGGPSQALAQPPPRHTSREVVTLVAFRVNGVFSHTMPSFSSSSRKLYANINDHRLSIMWQGDSDEIPDAFDSISTATGTGTPSELHLSYWLCLTDMKNIILNSLSSK